MILFVPGSLNSRAVAGTLLGTINPEFTPIAVLNTEISTVSGNPRPIVKLPMQSLHSIKNFQIIKQ